MVVHKKNAASISNYFFKQEFHKKDLETNLSRSRELLPKDVTAQEFARGYSQSKVSLGANQSSLHRFRIQSTSRNGSLDKTDRLDAVKPALNLTTDSNLVLIGIHDSNHTPHSPPKHAPRKSLKPFISNATQPQLVYHKQLSLHRNSSQKQIDLNLKTSPKKNPSQPVLAPAQTQLAGISARKAQADANQKQEPAAPGPGPGPVAGAPAEAESEARLVRWEDCLGGEDVRSELRFGDCLGQGSFAKVYEAFDRRLQASVAVKVVDKRKIREGDAKKRALVEEELRVLSQMRHPCIVKLLRVVEDAKRVPPAQQVFVVMELCSRCTLSTFARDAGYNRLPEAVCFQVFQQIVSAVEYMHERDFAHRDLKMTNILIDTTSQCVKIIDFGFACRASQLQSLYCGTPSYMPPEIVQRGSYFAKPVDVWTLGCVLFKLATNEYPFGGSGW